MTDTTAARRALLNLLLDRVERGALLPAEAPLIRPLVLAEQGAADRAADYDNRLTWETTCGEHARLLDSCRAADERAEQAEDLLNRVWDLADQWEQHGLTRDQPYARALRATLGIIRVTVGAAMADVVVTALDGPPDGPLPTRRTYYRADDGAEMHAEYMRLLAAAARVRELHRKANNGETCVYCAPMQRTGYDTTWPCDTIRALDGPSPTDDDTPTTPDDAPTASCRVMPTRTCPEAYSGPCGDRPCARFESDDPAPWAPPGTPQDVLDALRDGQPVTLDAPSEQCAALYTGDPGGWWRCERTTGHDGPHRAAPDAEHHREWPEDKAVYAVPTDAPSEPQP